MEVSALNAHACGRSSGDGESEEVIWHDLECGGYRADLPLWRELAGQADPTPGSEQILDVGAGTGRVALDLARRGHRVTAIDMQPALLAALAERAAGTAITTVRADARSFDLGHSDFALCLVPMQTLQLLGGGDARAAFLARARAHLRPGAPIACAIVTALEPFDSANGDVEPSAESAMVAGRCYISRATAVRLHPQKIVIERERGVLSPGEPASVQSAPERDVIELDRVRVSRLQREGQQAGLSPLGTREIPATAEHVSSTVVMFGA